MFGMRRSRGMAEMAAAGAPAGWEQRRTGQRCARSTPSCSGMLRTLKTELKVKKPIRWISFMMDSFIFRFLLDLASCFIHRSDHFVFWFIRNMTPWKSLMFLKQRWHYNLYYNIRVVALTLFVCFLKQSLSKIK